MNELVFSLPSITFKRCFNLGDAIMKAYSNKETRELELVNRRQRTTQAFAIDQDDDTPGAHTREETRNLVWVEDALVPNGMKGMIASFSCIVTPLQQEPYSCENPAALEDINRLLAYLRSDGANAMAAREYASACYAYNLLNGSWLWRNREISDAINVSITMKEGGVEKTISAEDVQTWPLRPVLPGNHEGKEPFQTYILGNAEFLQLAKAIAKTLIGDSPLHLAVSASLQLPGGTAVYPSQLFTPRKKTENGGELGREYFRIGGQFAISAQKMNNAIRTFDKFHNNEAYPNAVIPFEPLGSSLKLNENLRTINGTSSIYAVLPRLIVAVRDGVEAPNKEDLIYCLGVLIRGGLLVKAGGDDDEVATEKRAAKAAKKAAKASAIVEKTTSQTANTTKKATAKRGRPATKR